MTLRARQILYCWLPLVAYCLLIYIQSSYPSPESLPGFIMADKLLHFGAYGIMGILFYRAYATLRIGERLFWLVVLSIASASLYGISDEIHQSFVPYREASALDVVADVVGAGCGVWVYHLLTSAESFRHRC